MVVTRSHEDFYRDQLSASPDPNFLIQPDNRGTAAAILFALLRIVKRDPHAVVSVFPSDHYVDNEELFMCHADLALRMANLHRQQLVLLGITPERAESEYGWIEPAGSLCERSTLLRVARLWEQPPESLARHLWQRGCFIWPAVGTPDEHEAMEVAYANIPCRDLAEDVLTQNTADLVIVPVEGLYWNDLGDPRRVYETLARMQIRPGWMTQRTALNKNDFYS